MSYLRSTAPWIKPACSICALLMVRRAGASGSSGDPVQDISSSLQNLHISGSGNSVVLNFTVQTDTSRSAGSAVQDGGSVGTSQAADQGVSGDRAPSPRRRYYVVARTGRGASSLRGIWHCPWYRLEARLPGKKLFGSGCRPCKGFDDWADALACWESYCPEESPVVHRP